MSRSITVYKKKLVVCIDSYKISLPILNARGDITRAEFFDKENIVFYVKEDNKEVEDFCSVLCTFYGSDFYTFPDKPIQVVDFKSSDTHTILTSIWNSTIEINTSVSVKDIEQFLKLNFKD